jgi:putative oxidoreductase
MNGFAKNSLVPLVLRLGLAAIFLYHGMEKVSEAHHWGTAWSPSLPAPLQFATALVELLSGLALLAGFLTRLAAAAGGLITAGAIYFVHGQYGFGLQTGDAFKQGYEYKFALLVMCAAVLLLGSGTLALDWLFRSRPHTPSPGPDSWARKGHGPAADAMAEADAHASLAVKG